jgi:hypothetical protein
MRIYMTELNKPMQSDQKSTQTGVTSENAARKQPDTDSRKIAEPDAAKKDQDKRNNSEPAKTANSAPLKTYPGEQSSLRK